MASDNQEEDFAALLAEYEPEQRGKRGGPSVGDMVSGAIISIGRDSVFVEIGAKSEGVLDREQVSNDEGELRVAVGDTIEARVVSTKGGTITLRTQLSRGPDAAGEIAQAFEHGMPVEGVVGEVNKGGVEVQIAGMRAFCPVSQLDNRFVDDPTEYVGRKLTFKITRFEPGRGRNANIVVSRRALLEEEAAARAVETRKTLAVGSVLRGTVTSIKPYGAFVDIGGLEGMLHISELGYQRVEHPADILSEGQELDVLVLKIDKTDNPKRPEKIGLSLKAMAADPWHDAITHFSAGDRVKGTVVRTEAFGAFVELAPGIEGLVHVSELGASKRVNHAREVVKVGEAVEVTVLGIDKAKKRISLSIGAVQAAEEAADAASYKPASSDSLGTFADLFNKNK